MGLFSFVGKAIGAVARQGLSLVTQGASEKVLNLLKKVKGRPPVKAALAAAPTAQIQAFAAKNQVTVPRLSQTESHSSGEGWEFRAKQGKSMGKRKSRPRELLYEAEVPVSDPPARAKVKVATSSGKKTAAGPKKQTRSARQYAAWKAAGKPSTFFDWVKVNGKAIK